MSNFEVFIEKAKEITAEGIAKGKSCDAIEKDLADYFGMDLSGYRKTMSSALKARHAQQVFTVNYYAATHADANNTVIAERLGLPEIAVKSARDMH